MAIYGKQLEATYLAWNAAIAGPKSADSSNHTYFWIKDGVKTALASVVTELDTTNIPGLCWVTISAANAQCHSGVIAGTSSTASVEIIPTHYTFGDSDLSSAISAWIDGLATEVSDLSSAASSWVDGLATELSDYSSAASGWLQGDIGGISDLSSAASSWVDGLATELSDYSSAASSWVDALATELSDYSSAASGWLVGVDTDIDTLTTNVSDLSSAASSWIDGVATELSDYSSAASGWITGQNDLSAAEVNAEVVDALTVDARGEPGQVAPSASTSIAYKIDYLYKSWRNKKMQDATTWELYDDAGSTVDQKATLSDDGTDFTKGEIVSGA